MLFVTSVANIFKDVSYLLLKERISFSQLSRLNYIIGVYLVKHFINHVILIKTILLFIENIFENICLLLIILLLTHLHLHLALSLSIWADSLLARDTQTNKREHLLIEET